MKRNRKAKIVATLGPASSTKEAIRALFKAGADVFRFNFSHGSHEEHQSRYHILREVEREMGRPIAVLADLQGPKLRVGTFAGGKVTLRTGDAFRVDSDLAPGDESRVGMPHPEVFAALKPGVELLLDDGKIRLAVTTCGEDWAQLRVVAGGALSDRKGVSVVGALLPMSALTEKDRVDLAFALDMGADWLALSFVQRPEDMVEVRELVKGRAAIMAKLEKPSAIDCLEEIVRLSDGLMVARGDLGVEMRPEQVPILQRRILRECRKSGKPVIVATQMLESMISAPTPTRAEASDVATAIYDGADAVMLSAESAAGLFPVEAVAFMEHIIQEVEKDPYSRLVLDAAHPQPTPTIADAICSALRRVVALLDIAAAVTYTNSGSTSLRAARERPAAPILSMSPSLEVARRMALVWGVHSVLIGKLDSIEGVVESARKASRDQGFAATGDVIAITAGTPFNVSGTTNLLKLAIV
ncbi:pyruvate kinase [uncultured Rhodoblastus sp.]|uniref:pyruvate kinase n=1 Tax=uncultured Rhodoblastus sp. TaxID=543037 RepID=UPI0025EDE80C|nr:pyruvate kinase [uncultured Rhodoblastus sp.]